MAGGGTFKAVQGRRSDYGNQMEILVSLIYHEVVKANDVVIDGGANGGLHAVPLARLVGPHGRLICFEPLPNVFANLEQYLVSTKLRDTAELHCAALGDRSGSVSFVPVSANFGLSHVKVDWRDGELSDHKLIEVPLKTIDTTFALDRLSFIKLDLEGYDFLALRGGKETIKRFKPLVFFENARAWDGKKYDYSKDQFFQLFDDLDYDVYDFHNQRLNEESWESSDIGFEFYAIHRQDDRLDNVKDIIVRFWERIDDRAVMNVWADCIMAVANPKKYLSKNKNNRSRWRSLFGQWRLSING